jgi:hypothetical protein
LFVIVITLAMSSLAWGWEKPTGFRNIPWGTTMSQAKALRVSLVQTHYQTYADSIMIGQTKAALMLRFDSGGLDLFTLIFPSADYPTIKALFIERHGEPTQAKQSTVKNAMGASFENELLIWVGERTVIRLERYSGKITESFAVMATKEGYAAIQAKEAQGMESAKKAW